MQNSRPLHVGLVCPAWPVEEFQNGIITYVHVLRSELLGQGHRVSVFAGMLGRKGGGDGIYRVDVPLQYRISRRFTGGRMSALEFASRGKVIAAKINQIDRTDPIDVVEMEEFHGWCADVQRKVRMPVVVKLHGPAFLTLTEQNSRAAKARIDAEGRGLKQMQVVVAPSRATLESTVSRYRLQPSIAEVLPNPLMAEPGMKPWALEHCDRKTILFVGRFDRHKGGDTALAAFRRLLESDPDLKLVFVGRDDGLATPDGGRVSFQQLRDSLFSEPQRSSVSYRGFLPRADIFELRTRAMVTIMTSRWENQPNTALEAMLQGCPLVGVDAGGMGEIVEDGKTGLLARPDDLDDLCGKISSLLADPEKARRLGQSARRSMMERHSPEALTRRNVEVYLQAMSMAGLTPA